MPYSAGQKPARSGAITPVLCYLVNLLGLPVIGFLPLAWLYLRSSTMPALRRAHVRAAFYMSIIGFVLISGGVAGFWLAFGHTGSFWSGAIVYIIVLHTSFVLWGMIALAQAIGDKPPYFPRRFV